MRYRHSGMSVRSALCQQRDLPDVMSALAQPAHRLVQVLRLDDRHRRDDAAGEPPVQLMRRLRLAAAEPTVDPQEHVLTIWNRGALRDAGPRLRRCCCPRRAGAQWTLTTILPRAWFASMILCASGTSSKPKTRAGFAR